MGLDPAPGGLETAPGSGGEVFCPGAGTWKIHVLVRICTTFDFFQIEATRSDQASGAGASLGGMRDARHLRRQLLESHTQPILSSLESSTATQSMPK